MVHLKVNFIESSHPRSPCVVHFEMPSESTILDLKQRITTLYSNIYIQAQTLEFDEQTLQDSRSLESYGIQDHSVLNLRLATLRPSSKFHVQIVSTHNFQMEVKSSMSVQVLKKSIAKILGVSSKTLTLYHKNDTKGINETISDDDSLGRYNLDENSAIEAWDMQ